MRTKRLALWLILVTVLAVTSACGPQAIPPQASTSTDADTLVVQLPAIYLDVAADGQMTLAEGPLTQVIAALGVDLSNLSMSQETVQRFIDNNIQHVQLANQPDGLHIFINGQALPTLAWDDASFASLVNVLGILGTDLGDAGQLLKLLPDLGVGAVLKFPVKAGTAAIPLGKGTPATAAMLENNLANAVSASAAIAISLNYAKDGSFQLQGLSPFMLGMIPADALQQTPDAIAGITDQGIKSLSIKARPTGLLISINGEALPYLRSSDEAQLLNMIQLVLKLAAGEEQAAQLGGIVGQVLPALWRQGLELSVNFPAA